MSRVIQTGISADEPDRAFASYREILAWEIQNWEGPIDHWLITTGAEDEAGINGALEKRTDPAAGTWPTVEVGSVDHCVAKVLEGGGSVILSKTAVPGGGYQVYCRETEGSVLGVN